MCTEQHGARQPRQLSVRQKREYLFVKGSHGNDVEGVAALCCHSATLVRTCKGDVRAQNVWSAPASREQTLK